MKFSFLSKTVGVLGLVATLSAIVAPSITKSVQAQTQPSVNSQSEAGAPSANLNITEILSKSGGQYDDNHQDGSPF